MYQQKVEQHHVLTYGANVQMVAQQMQNKLRMGVTEAPCSGEAHVASDLIGSLEYLESQGRDRRNPENVPENTRRWLVRPNEIESGQYIDKEDKFDQHRDPTSQLVMAHTAAVQRGLQDRILGVTKGDDGTFTVTGGGVLGRATEGKRPGATKALPASQVVPAGATGLDLDKLRAARLILQKADFGIDDYPGDELWCAISPQQADDLIGLAAATGTALNPFMQMQLVEGKPTKLMGINWIVTNRLPLAGNERSCPLWSKANIAFGIWQDVEGRMWNDGHAKNLPYAHVGAFVDCVRIEDGGVVNILCQEGS